jgi:vitamin B12 transporter
VLLTSPAAAQHAVFSDELIVTATGDERPANDVPLPATVITREEIEDAQEESVADLVRRAPGVTVMRAGGDGSATSVFTRGTDSDHTLALFDGVRLNSPYFGGYDWSLMPTAGLERVEVVRGPFSALWGADAIGGVINVVPARAATGLSTSLVGEAGEDGWRRFDGAVGYGDGGFDLYASAFEREGRGELANSDFSATQVLLDAGWSWADGRRVAVLVQQLETDLGIPFSSPGVATPRRRQSADQRLFALPLTIRIGPSWRMDVVASTVERELRFRDPDDPWGFTRSDTEADTFQARLASHHRVAGHDLSWGGEWRRDEVSDRSSFGANLVGRTAAVASLFAQDLWRLGDAVIVIAGVRWDDADRWGSEVSPRLAAGFNVATGIELRAAFGHAFRQPSVGELYFPFSGNPDLAPEEADSVEVGVGWTVGRSRLHLDGFATDIDNLVDFDNVNQVFANVTEARTRGVEAGWEMVLAGGTGSSLELTWLDTEDADGRSLLRRPAFSAAWTLHGGLGERFSGDLTVLWVGARDDVDPTTFARTELGGHLTASLATAVAVMEGLELTLRAENLADREYQEVAGYPAPGRRVVAGLRWRH